MPTRLHSPQPNLKELINGMLTLLDWQEQLVREALAKLADADDRAECLADSCPQSTQSP